MPNPFGETISSMPDYLLSASLATPGYLVYSFPVILFYGVLTSSDKIGQLISIFIKKEPSEIIFSAILHAAFGLILLWLSLGASALFFLTDRVLQKRRAEYEPMQALKSLAIPCAVWLFFMTIVYLEGILIGG
ncbi:hypothetical protein [Lentibacillus saliphilus]|uniref:hypothetical protein n=1 Tax=Lentibacillus saliphilus TaxID=2737028 RepID=UPI001FE8FE8C|nr:hypothetical protein [Lentibacillus saliphilus]